MKTEILRVCRTLLQPGDRVVCALSGGGDSVALLHCLLALKEALQISVAAAHFNHCLRGTESDADEAFVRQLCAQWGVELTVGRGDPRSRAGESPEEAARNLRYAFLLEQEGLIATAHHGDDQLETVLLNLLRGTGLPGLCGMQPRTGRLLRPMLTVPKAEIEAYLAANGLPCRFDSSNGCDDALRNRLRHHVIPLLKQENPNLTETASRMTTLLQQDEAYLRQQTDQLLAQAADQDGYRCCILLEAPAVLRRRAIRQLLAVPKPSMAHVEQVERLLQNCAGSASVALPGGVTAIREYDRLRFLTTPPEDGFSSLCIRPGETVPIPELGLTVSFRGPVLLESKTDQRSVFAIKADGGFPAICIRSRQSGDRLLLPGGHKTLKKCMIDQKIPAAQRSRLPVLEDDRGIFAVYQLGCHTARQAHPGEMAWIIQFHTEERNRDAEKNDEENGYDGRC